MANRLSITIMYVIYFAYKYHWERGCFDVDTTLLGRQ